MGSFESMKASAIRNRSRNSNAENREANEDRSENNLQFEVVPFVIGSPQYINWNPNEAFYMVETW